jgi:Gram-negative bacterial TonB protein C-terminal/MORN repeat variant
MKKLLIQLFVLLNFTNAFAGGEEKTIYLDTQLEVVKKKGAAFYANKVFAGDMGFAVKAYFLSGELKYSGYYKNEDLRIPNGKFIYYHQNGKIESQGEYINGAKSGLWERFDETGKPKQERFYTINPLDSKIYTEPDMMPEFFGGQEAFDKFLVENIKSTFKSKIPDKKAEVLVSFVINQSGLPDDIKVINGLTPEIDKEIVTVLTNMPRWLPGQKDKKNVNVGMLLPIEIKD